MSKSHQNTVTENFIREMDKVIRSGHAKNMTEIANECKYYIQGLSDIVKGRRNVSIDLLHRFINRYNIDANSIFKSSHKEGAQQKPYTASEPPGAYPAHHSHLHELLRAKDKIIETQSDLIQSLKRELQRPGNSGQKRKAN